MDIKEMIKKDLMASAERNAKLGRCDYRDLIIKRIKELYPEDNNTINN